MHLLSSIGPNSLPTHMSQHFRRKLKPSWNNHSNWRASLPFWNGLWHSHAPITPPHEAYAACGSQTNTFGTQQGRQAVPDNRTSPSRALLPSRNCSVSSTKTYPERDDAWFERLRKLRYLVWQHRPPLLPTNVIGLRGARSRLRLSTELLIITNLLCSMNHANHATTNVLGTSQHLVQRRKRCKWSSWLPSSPNASWFEKGAHGWAQYSTGRPWEAACRATWDWNWDWRLSYEQGSQTDSILECCSIRVYLQILRQQKQRHYLIWIHS